MKRIFLLCIVLLSWTAQAQTRQYLMTAWVWAECGQVRAELDGQVWYFNGGWTQEVYQTAQIVTFTGDLATKTVYASITGNEACCNIFDGSLTCGNTQQLPMRTGTFGCYSAGFTNSWEIDLAITPLGDPVVQSVECDRVRVGVPQFCGYPHYLKWEVSANPTTGPWYLLAESGSVDVTPGLITTNTPLNPYGPLYIRDIPGSFHTPAPNQPAVMTWFNPSGNIPISLYHAAPTMTLTPTDQICTTVSGVRASNVTLAFGRTKLTIREEVSPGVFQTRVPDTEYTTAQLDGLFFNLAPGKYQLAARNWGGSDPNDVCPNTFSFEIKGTYPEVQITPVVTDEKCFGPAATGAISLTPGGTGITPPYTYAWTHDASLTAKDLTGLPGDRDYTVTVTDKNGCIGTTTLRVEEPDAISIARAYVISNHNGADVSCNSQTIGIQNDGAIRIEATGGTNTLQYRLDGMAHTASYQGSADFTGLYADIYSVYVRDANNCEVQHTATVPVTAPGDIAYSRLDVTPLRCAGVSEGAITIVGATGGTGPIVYALNSGPYQPSNTFDNQSNGNYTVSIRDANGCRKDLPATIGQPLPLQFSSIDLQPESCADKLDGSITAVATGGTGLIEYALEDTPTAYNASGEFTGLKAGPYTVYVRDANNCSTSQPQILTPKAALAGPIAVTQRVRCNGESNGILTVTVSGGTAPYKYTWSANPANATTAAAENLPAGVYTVTVRDDKGCQADFTQTMPQPDPLQLTPDLSDYNGYGVRCAGNTDGAIDLGVSGGNVPYQFDWGADGTIQNLQNKPAGTYHVVVTDSRGCEAIRQGLVLTAPPILQLSTGPVKNISCKGGADGNVPLQASGGVGDYHYSSDGLAWEDEPLFTGLTAQGYTFRVRDENNCNAQATATLTEPLEALVLDIVTKTETICGQANGSAEVKANGGTGAYAYTWYDGPTAISQTTVAVSLRSGDYQVVVRDDNACEANVEVIMNDSDGPRITQQALVGLTCHDSHDGLIRISVNEGAAPYTLTWDITGENGLEVADVTGGPHWVEVRDTKDCRAKVEFNVPAPAPVTIDYALTEPTCQGDTDGSIEVTAHGGNVGGYRYVWGDNAQTEPLRNGLGAGTYSVSIADSKNCSAEATIVLTDPTAFTIDAGGDRTICVGQRVNVNVQQDDIETYQWTSSTNFTSSASVVELREPGTYTLSVVSVRGCRSSDSFVIQTSTDVLQADFLMAAEALVGDTVVVVDISWPVPEGLQWIVPEGAELIEQEETYGGVVFAEPGEYTIVLNTSLGECIATLSKSIAIGSDGGSDVGREGRSLIAGFDVYPNPNNGQFTVSVVLRRADVVARVRMLSVTGDRRLFDAELLDNGEYQYNGDALPAGVYLVLLEAGKEQRVKRVVVE